MNLIVAVDSKWGIGRRDQLLIRVSDDMKRFRALTLGKTVILGRRTLQTFPGGRPLEQRTNLVLTRSLSFAAEPAVICRSLDELALRLQELDKPDDEVFVIGGASVYSQLLPYCRLAYVTRFHRTADADCHFQDLDHSPGWRLLTREDHHTDQAKLTGDDRPIELDYSFCLYEQAEPRCLIDGAR